MSTPETTPPVFDPDGMPPYADYLGLLGKKLMLPDDSVDVIIVPQGRPAEYIQRAARLAHAAGSMLVSLCSHDASITEVAKTLDAMSDAPASWYAVDMPPGYQLPGVQLRAQQEIPDVARRDPGWDLSHKLNAGLVIGRMIGSESIFFHDDDLKIELEAPRSVAHMLFGRDIAGLRCGGMPDKSMIMHAADAVHEFHFTSRYRYASNHFNLKAGQISNNSLGVNPQRVEDHFPDGIYNLDWLFAYQSVRQGRAGLSEHKYYQDTYDPFVAGRARQEEFGDLVIDGIYGNMKKMLSYGGDDEGLHLYHPGYWQQKVEARCRQYEFLLTAITASKSGKIWGVGMIPVGHWRNVTMPVEQQEKLRQPLEAGLAVNEALSGTMFVDYLRAWGEDRRRWSGMLQGLPKVPDIKGALSHLGLTDFISNV